MGFLSRISLLMVFPQKKIQGDHGELSDRPFLYKAPGGYYSPETYDWVDLAEPLERCVEGSFVVHEGEEIMQLGSGWLGWGLESCGWGDPWH